MGLRAAEHPRLPRRGARDDARAVPLVYLPVAASLRGADPAQEEIARGLGLGRIQTFSRVTLAECRAAIFGGSLIVARSRCSRNTARSRSSATTRSPPRSSPSSTAPSTRPSACALSLVLVLICLFVLTGEAGARAAPGATARVVGRAAIHRHSLGRATLPVLLAFVALGGLALGVPIGTLIYWMVRGSSSTLPSASIIGPAWHTALYSAGAAALATALALPVALVAVRQRRRSTALLERSTYIVQALPGLVIALALVFFASRWASSLYQSPQLLVLAYAILFFPLALVAVKASVAARRSASKTSADRSDAARSRCSAASRFHSSHPGSPPRSASCSCRRSPSSPPR